MRQYALDHGAADMSAKAAPPVDWAAWTDSGRLPGLQLLAERQEYEHNVAALWREVRTSIVDAIADANTRLPEPRRIECGDTPTGGLALTRWSEYPLALLDASIDAASGMIACIYTFAQKSGDQYRDLYKVWLVRASGSGLVLADEHGHAVTSPAELAQQVVAAYLTRL